MPECAYLESPPVECVLGEHPPALPHVRLDQGTAEAVLGFDMPGFANLKVVTIMIHESALLIDNLIYIVTISCPWQRDT